MDAIVVALFCPLIVALWCLPGSAHASPDSALTLQMATGLATAMPGSATAASATGYQVEVDLHSNRLVRGMALFHRPGEDLLAQKLAVVPGVRWRLQNDTEVTWHTDFALQDRVGTRAELPHTDLRQQFRARRRYMLGKWTLLPACGLLVSFQRSGSVRLEASTTGVRRWHGFDIEAQALQHQAVYGEALSVWSFSYGHLQIWRWFDAGRWLLGPYLRAAAEIATLQWHRPAATSLQAGLLTRWHPENSSLAWLFGLETLYRIDLQETTLNLSLGVRWRNDDAPGPPR